MKVRLFTTVSVVLISNVLVAQKLKEPQSDKPELPVEEAPVKEVKRSGTSRFQVKIYGGYGVAVGNTYNYFGEQGTIQDNILTSNTSFLITKPDSARTLATIGENTPGLGTGERFGLGFSYIVNDYINLGIDFDYFSPTITRKRTDVIEVTYPMLGNLKNTITRNTNYRYDAKIVNVSPNITFKAISRNSFFVFNRLGVTLTPFYKILRYDDVSSTGKRLTNPSVDSSFTSNKIAELKLKFPVGFFASFGGNFKIGGPVRAFIEMQYTSIIFTGKTKEVTSYKENGVDRLNSILRKDIFTREFPIANPNPNPNSPTRSIPAVRVPVTNFSLLGGITLRF
jgi:hypothetical protein